MSETRARTYQPEDRLTRQEAADYLCISLPRLAQLRREGKIRHEKNPETRAVRYRFADVERLHRERTRVVLGA